MSVFMIVGEAAVSSASASLCIGAAVTRFLDVSAFWSTCSVSTTAVSDRCVLAHEVCRRLVVRKCLKAETEVLQSVSCCSMHPVRHTASVHMTCRWESVHIRPLTGNPAQIMYAKSYAAVSPERVHSSYEECSICATLTVVPHISQLPTPDILPQRMEQAHQQACAHPVGRRRHDTTCLDASFLLSEPIPHTTEQVIVRGPI